MNRYLCGAEAVLAETGVLGRAARVTAFEFAQQVLTQLALALAVDEHDALAVLVDIGVHHLTELVHLVLEDGSGRHAVEVVHQRGDVQVLDDNAVVVDLFLYRLAMRTIHALFLFHGTFQFTTVDVRHARWTVIGNDFHGDDGHVKIGILVETMQLIELGHVKALLH